MTERERIDFDVLFVGGGPACFAGAIQLMKLAEKQGLTPEVALIEKGAEIGAHALSGAILNPIALKELVPDYRDRGCPIEATVRGDEFYFLTATRHIRMPMVPRYMHNTGFHVVSLARFTRWLAEMAEEMGVNIFPGFAGKEVLFSPDGQTVAGVRTGDKGLDKEGQPKANFEAGIDLMAKVTVFGEGARGSLMKDLYTQMAIGSGKLPQVYETGIKEVIQLPAESNYFATSRGNDIHTLGYPLGLDTPGGGFIYEMKDNKIAIGFLTALCYQDAMLDPYDEFIKFKQHPFIAGIIKGGKVLEQGARTVTTGGLYAMPQLAVGGGLFVGGAASIHNAPALKGVHVSMKSGMLAAEATLAALAEGRCTREALNLYPRLVKQSWLQDELHEGRNFAQALAKKAPIKFIHLGAQYVTQGRGMQDPLPLEEDHRTLKPHKPSANRPAVPDKKSYDGTLYVDKLTGVYLSRTMHREDQPCHLIVHDTELCVTTCYDTYRSPCTRFCPGKVYEMEEDQAAGQRRLKLNPANCLHCKTCDVKDPFENITWTCPEGGEGPGYTLL